MQILSGFICASEWSHQEIRTEALQTLGVEQRGLRRGETLLRAVSQAGDGDRYVRAEVLGELMNS
jgi:hypothetical protein